MSRKKPRQKMRMTIFWIQRTIAHRITHDTGQGQDPELPPLIIARIAVLLFLIPCLF